MGNHINRKVVLVRRPDGTPDDTTLIEEAFHTPVPIGGIGNSSRCDGGLHFGRARRRLLRRRHRSPLLPHPAARRLELEQEGGAGQQLRSAGPCEVPAPFRYIPVTMWRQTGCAAAAAVLLALGCGCREDAKPPDSPEAARAPAGAEVIEVSDGLVRLHASNALQLSVLEQLAAGAGFELVVAGVDPQRLSLKLDGVPLADAIAALLPEERYTLEYAFDRRTGAHVLAVLRVGDGNPAPSVALAPARPISAPAAPRAEAAQTTEPERDARERASSERIASHRERIARLREEREQAGRGSESGRRLRDDLFQERSELQEELRKAIDDPDPAVRAEAVRELDTAGGDNRERVKALAHDPDPKVREAAAERLGDDGSFQAVSGLLEMLRDPEPEVLVATIEALDDAGDDSLIPYLEPLAQHPDPEVREVASEVLDQWKW